MALLDTAMAAQGGPTVAADADAIQDEPKTELPTNVMRLVRLTYAAAAEAREVVASAVPGVGLTADSRTNSLIIVGPDELQARVDQLIAALDVKVDVPVTGESRAPEVKPAPEAPAPVRTLQAFHINQADPAAVREALALILPRDAVHVDTRTRTAIVLGLPEDIAMASEIVEMLDTSSVSEQQPRPEPEPPADVMRVIRLEHAAATQIREAISSAVPGVRLTADSRTNSLIVVAPGETQAKVDDLIAALDIGLNRLWSPLRPRNCSKPEPEIARGNAAGDAAPAQCARRCTHCRNQDERGRTDRFHRHSRHRGPARTGQADHCPAGCGGSPSADEIAAPSAPADLRCCRCSSYRMRRRHGFERR